jgi:hypothetical protein
MTFIFQTFGIGFPADITGPRLIDDADATSIIA